MITGRPDSWQIVFVLVAGVFTIFQMVRGWRRGLARQFFNLLGLIGAYTVAIYGGDALLPMVRHLGFPDLIAALLGGAVLALLVFAGISSLGVFLFKRSTEKTGGAESYVRGVAGAMIGLVFGLFAVWTLTLAIRLLGTVAESEIIASKNAAAMATPGHPPQPPPESSGMITGLAHMKQSLEVGAAGSVVRRVDPLPLKTYSVMAKIIQMISNPESIGRFLAYPGAKDLTSHPKIVALFDDPVIEKDLEKGNLLALLHNERVVQAANDPEITRLLTRFDLEKALDYSLTR